MLLYKKKTQLKAATKMHYSYHLFIYLFLSAKALLYTVWYCANTLGTFFVHI